MTGSFMSRDSNEPKVRDGEGMPVDPKELHKYLYSGDDPVNKTDPTGRVFSEAPAPELKQVRDLTRYDFARHPIWIGVHNFDLNQPWYSSSDEDTYRPWSGPIPVAAEIGFVLVIATFVLKNGVSYPGFVRAVRDDWDVPPPPSHRGGQAIQLPAPSSRYGGSPLAVLGFQRPCVFVDDRPFGFWGGRKGISSQRRADFYRAVANLPQDVFPIHFYAETALATGIVSGQVDGFYRANSGQSPICEL